MIPKLLLPPEMKLQGLMIINPVAFTVILHLIPPSATWFPNMRATTGITGLTYFNISNKHNPILINIRLCPSEVKLRYHRGIQAGKMASLLISFYTKLCDGCTEEKYQHRIWKKVNQTRKDKNCGCIFLNIATIKAPKNSEIKLQNKIG